MGLLDDSLYDDLRNKPAAAPRVQPQQPVMPGAQPIAPTNDPGLILAGYKPGNTPGVNPDPNAAVKVFGDITPQEQIKRFGGEVGSGAYYQEKASNSFLQYLPKQLAETVGIRLPSDEDWDRMSLGDKALTAGKASANMLGRMVMDLPKEIVKAPFRVANTIVSPWVQMATGKAGSLESLANEEPLRLPWLGEVPTYFQSYKQASDSGMGPLASTLMTVGSVAGDVSILGSLGEAVAVVGKPRAQIIAGQPVKATAPIQAAIRTDAAGIGSAVKKRPGSVSEYYSLPKTVVKDNYGTAANNTFLKMTPAGSGSVEVSVVELRGGALQKGMDYVKDKLGQPTKRYEGDFGPEVKLESKIVNVNPSESTGVARLASEMTDADAQQIFRSIPAKPLKGFETKPITGEQIKTLEEVGNFNGIEPSIRDAVVRSVTGKSVVGEMTQAEFVKAAQTLQTFSPAGKFAPDLPHPSIFAKSITPQRHWMRSYEESSGIPLYSQIYTPMEEATRVRNVFRDNYRNEVRDIHGKFADAKYAEERRLISSYMRGEKDAILKNDALTPEMKTEMIAVADGMRGFYDKIGPQVDVPTDIFLKDYQPGVRDLGGVFNIYKSGSNEFPTMKEFFAKEKKTGDLGGVQIDDSLALADIYVNAGSNWMFMKPTLDRVKAAANELPQTVRGAAKNYVEEKLGYGGQLEEFLDNMVPGINKKLGLNLPPDAARQLSNYTLSTMYSGMLSSPATWFRQAFQYPLFGYARLGPKFAGDAIKKGLSKEGIQEARNAGFIVDLGVPYGEELLKETRAVGRFANAYKNTTQAIIKPNSMADAGQRSIVFQQGKMQFDDALARYNKGEITWDKLEKDMDFSSLSPVDRNIIRQKLVEGDIEGGFNHYIREIIDETNFPYRRGASSQLGYGLSGKLATSLLQWPIEAGHVLGRWTKNGQWDKLIRFYAASSAIQRTMSETFGFDFQRNLSAGGMFGNFWSPYVKTGIDAVNAFTQFFQGNKEEFNKNADSIVRTLKAGAVPGGIAIQNVEKFYKSYERGPNQDGKYAIMNQDGEVSYYTDFADLFWGQLMGFPTNAKEDASRLTKDIRNAQFDRKQQKAEIMQLMQQEKYDEAARLMGEYGISVTPQDMDDYYIPLNERTFKSLPGPLKAQFAPQVYPVPNQ